MVLCKTSEKQFKDLQSTIQQIFKIIAQIVDLLCLVPLSTPPLQSHNTPLQSTNNNFVYSKDRDRTGTDTGIKMDRFKVEMMRLVTYTSLKSSRFLKSLTQQRPGLARLNKSLVGALNKVETEHARLQRTAGDVCRLLATLRARNQHLLVYDTGTVRAFLNHGLALDQWRQSVGDAVDEARVHATGCGSLVGFIDAALAWLSLDSVQQAKSDPLLLDTGRARWCEWWVFMGRVRCTLQMFPFDLVGLLVSRHAVWALGELEDLGALGVGQGARLGALGVGLVTLNGIVECARDGVFGVYTQPGLAVLVRLDQQETNTLDSEIEDQQKTNTLDNEIEVKLGQTRMVLATCCIGRHIVFLTGFAAKDSNQVCIDPGPRLESFSLVTGILETVAGVAPHGNVKIKGDDEKLLLAVGGVSAVHLFDVIPSHD